MACGGGGHCKRGAGSQGLPWALGGRPCARAQSTSCGMGRLGLKLQRGPGVSPPQAAG